MNPKWVKSEHEDGRRGDSVSITGRGKKGDAGTVS